MQTGGICCQDSQSSHPPFSLSLLPRCSLAHLRIEHRYDCQFLGRPCVRRGSFDPEECIDHSRIVGTEFMIKQTCQHCAHFVDDPAVIESEIPGLTSFGSAYSSARGHAGICREHDRFMDPMRALDCPSFEARRLNPDSPLPDRREPHSQICEKE